MSVGKEKINVLSLFDGMSCGQIALERAGLEVENYFASEIDKHAIKATMHNFPNTIQLGDVTKVKGRDLGHIDLLCFGSPCQGFSFAGKGLNFNDHRSALFFEAIRILNELREINPNIKFLAENVRMKKEHEMIFSKYLGVQPVAINSNLVSAQNRYRLYWFNWNLEHINLFGVLRPTIPQPKDKGIFIKDILQENVPEKYYISQFAINRILRKGYSQPKINPDKSGSINTKNNSAQLSIDSGTTLIGVLHYGRNDEGKRLRKESMAKGKDYTPFQAKEVTHIDAKKTNCITSVLKDNLVLQINPSLESGGPQPYQQNRIYDSEGITPALCRDKCDLLIMHNMMPRSSKSGKGGTGHLSRSDGKSYNLNTGNSNAVQINTRIRRLTPVECCRLQNVPDNYFYNREGKNVISDSQIYKCIGNGWTVDVISFIFSFLRGENF